MRHVSLAALAREQLSHAVTHSSGRTAATVFGGHEHHLRQTLIAMKGGSVLAEHESPGEATIVVLLGRVRIEAGGEAWEGSEGDLLIVPDERHSLAALDDSAVLLTVAMALT